MFVLARCQLLEQGHLVLLHLRLLKLLGLHKPLASIGLNTLHVSHVKEAWHNRSLLERLSVNYVGDFNLVLTNASNRNTRPEA